MGVREVMISICSILLLSYLVVVTGYYFSGLSTNIDSVGYGLSRFDTLATDGVSYISFAEKYKTAGRGTSTSGRAGPRGRSRPPRACPWRL